MSNSAYYYLLSFLPTLRFGEKPLITAQMFLDYCTEQLGGQVVDSFKDVSIFNCGKGNAEIIQHWNSWLIYSRNLMARHRGATLGVEATPYLKEENDLFVSKKRLIEEALQEKNPVKQLEAINSLSWQYLDELECGFQFTFENIVVYWLRLQINLSLTRDNPHGQECFARVSLEKAEEAHAKRSNLEE